MLQRNRIQTTLTFFLVLLSGCASGTLRPVTLSNELPTDLPKEMKDHFEVQEVLPTGTRKIAFTDDYDTEPSSSSKKLKHSRKHHKKNHQGNATKSNRREKNRKAAAAAAPKPFTYPIRRPAKDPIWVGERLVYSISYLGVSAGDFTLEILPFKFLGGRKVYHIQGKAVTSAIFSLIYRLNDSVESFMDYEGSFSHRFHIVLDESKQSRDGLELNDSEKGQTFYWNRWDHKASGYKETKEFAQVQPFSQDSLSALYYVRTIPLPPESTFTFPVISEGKTWEAVCTVVRREERKTPLGRVPTIVIRPEMKYQGILKKSGDSALWLTDDERRIPVRLEAKVRIGTVVANLKEVELGTPPPQPTQTQTQTH